MTTIKPTHAPIKHYYKALEEYAAQGIAHEGALRSAFQALLEATKPTGWLLVPEETIRVNDKHVRPDATIRDSFNHRRGYWEAKDTADDLDTEIVKKRKAGYPLTNIIFEDSRTAVLYQNGDLAMRVDITDPQNLADLLNRFWEYTEPPIENFERAIVAFKERVPDLARRLVAIIEEAHGENRAFQDAFEKFFDLCKRSLNPNLSVKAVDEMLVQHLLTERLFRTVFDNPDFVRRNVIAAEVEKVIDALTSHAFSRDEFLKSLDRFYLAIEDAARPIEDFTEKQHFLNTVYERFFQGYSVRLADTHGIVYTPRPIVEFMCNSVVEVLRTEFGKTLGAPEVYVLDPCVGTGNFIVHLLRRVPKERLEDAYKNRFFANEVMLLPYYIAALNIEHAYHELTGHYEPFEGLCFVDTLDLTERDRGREGDQIEMKGVLSQRNTERVERQKAAPITVIIGNPPYNMGQVNENDNNKNRKYPDVDMRIQLTYSAGSRATLKNKLYDPYVKFFRFATDRLGKRNGIVCLVSNNSFVDREAFDGMRKHLARDFDLLYHVDLHGNVRQNPKLSGTTHNVFGIQVGVGITVAVKRLNNLRGGIQYHRVPETWRKEDKLKWLEQREHVGHVEWTNITPDKHHNWIVLDTADEFSRLLCLGAPWKAARAPRGKEQRVVFGLHSLGVVTSRDEWTYDFSSDALERKLKRFIANYNYEVFRYTQEAARPKDIDSFVNNDPSFLKWTDRLKTALTKGRTLTFAKQQVRISAYRPFTGMRLYFDHLLNQRRYQQHRIFPTPETEQENRVICVTGVGSFRPFQTLAVHEIPCLDMLEKTQCFPFYVYDEDETNLRENITDWALNKFRARYRDASITKWDVFWYVYAILHHPGYREKFKDNLKRELPRIPLAGTTPLPSPRARGETRGATDDHPSDLFRVYVEHGKRLGELHLSYETVEPWPLEYVWDPDVPTSWRVEKMKLSKDRTELRVNETLTLRGIPAEVFDYRLGNRSALEWVIDQYQVKTDEQSGIASDPNGYSEDERYIVNLVCRVVRVSVETVRSVNEIAKLPFEQNDARDTSLRPV